MGEKMYDVKQTRNKREAKKLQEQGWELTGIDRSITWGNQFNLRKARAPRPTKSQQVRMEAQQQMIVAKWRLKRVTKKLEKKQTERLIARKEKIEAEIRRLSNRV